MDLLSKYAPKTVDEVAGNDEARIAVKKWALDWQRGVKRKPLLLSGPTGSGKTALVNALASEMGWDLVDGSKHVGAEDARRFFSSSSSLYGGSRVLLFDGVDFFDRKVVTQIAGVVEDFNGPVIFVADDLWSQSLSGLRALCEKVEFKGVGKYALKRALSGVVEKEGIAADVQQVVDNSSGDLRAALIDLQSGIGRRERKSDVFTSLKDVFKARSFGEAVQAGDSVDVDFDLFKRWIEENIPAEYEDPVEVAKAFDVFSRSDVFAGRIMRRQNYSLYKFVRALALGGVAMSKKEVYRKFSRYQFPGIIKLLGSSKKARQTRKELVRKIAGKTHASFSDAAASVWLCSLPGAREYFGLSDEEYSLAAGMADFKEDKQ